MARTKTKKPSAAVHHELPATAVENTIALVAKKRQPSALPSEDEELAEPMNLDEQHSDSENEKDAQEEELERLVFGDSAGFREGVKNFVTPGLDTEEVKADLDEENGHAGGFEGLDDADLFFTDTVGSGAMVKAEGQGDEDEEDERLTGRNAPAWEDSDEERLNVSLASVPRLRKLRRTEAEDVISGKEYVRRLRKQFVLLNPLPDWAVEASQRPNKKRRLTTDGDASDEGISSADEMDVDGEISTAPLSKLLRDANGLVRRADSGGKKRKLRPEVLDIQRTKDIEGTQPSAVTSLSFHPELPLLLSSGPSSTLYLHHITPSPPAPSPNPLLTSLHMKGTPLATTAFHPHDPRIFLSARRRFFHVWNLETGRVEKIARIYGHSHEQRSMENFKLSPDGRWMALLGSSRKGGGVINILDAHTLQWSSQVRVESRGGIADLAWWADSRGLCVAGKNGEVTEWNLEAQSVAGRWTDEGAVGTTTIALGGLSGQAGSPIGTDRWVAVGSSSGVVNVYDRRAWLVDAARKQNQASATNGAAVNGQEHDSAVPLRPKPTRTLDQLTTPTSHLLFSPDGQMMIMASRWKKDALRIVHLPSCTVYKNWPTGNTPLGRITGVAFGPGSDVLAVGNEAGKIRLWEIRA